MCVARLPAGLVANVGAGFTAAESPSHKVLAVDVDPEVLRGRSGAVAADVALLPFSDGVLDGVLLKDVLEHVPDPVAALAEVRRVCKPTAEMIVTVPRAIPRAVWADPTHVRGFTKRSLVWTLSMAGWDLTKPVRRMGSIPGAGRIPLLLHHAETLLRLPGFGHWRGLNWITTVRPSPGTP